MISRADGGQWPGIDQCLHLNKSMKSTPTTRGSREGGLILLSVK